MIKAYARQEDCDLHPCRTAHDAAGGDGRRSGGRRAWRPGQRGKQHARKDFSFGGRSPVNNQPYRYKAVDAVFADEPHAVVVVTVKVFYHD